MISFWIVLLTALNAGLGFCSPAPRVRVAPRASSDSTVSTFDYDPLMTPPSPNGLSHEDLTALRDTVPPHPQDQVKAAK